MDPATDRMVSSLKEAYHALPVEVRSSQTVQFAVRRRRRRALLSVTVILLLAAGAFSVSHGKLSGSAGKNDVRVVAQAQSERWPSSTLTDWMDEADGVVIAVVTGEERAKEMPSSTHDERVIGRSVALRVENVLWKRPGSEISPHLSLAAMGWVTGGDNASLIPLAAPRTPRLEVGNSYVIALQSVQCGDAKSLHPSASAWTPLGGEAIWPISGDRIGYGESEGRRVAGDTDQVAHGSFEADMLGSTGARLKNILTSAWNVDIGQSSRRCS